MKIKTSELIGVALDWAVAKCEGDFVESPNQTEEENLSRYFEHYGYISYSTDWSQGGPIIEKYIDAVRKRSKAEEATLAHPNPNFRFKAEISGDIKGYFCGFGPTPLIAAARCRVSSKLGDVVDVPEELCK